MEDSTLLIVAGVAAVLLYANRVVPVPVPPPPPRAGAGAFARIALG